MKQMCYGMLLCLLLLFAPAADAADSGEGILDLLTRPVSRKGNQNARALNHVSVSLYKIAHANNAAVLEEEYDALVNGLDLSAINDEQLPGVINPLMDRLESLRLSESERARLAAAYEAMQQKRLLKTLRGDPDASRLTNAISLLALLPSAGAVGADDLQNETAFADFAWNPDKQKLEELKTLNRQFLAACREYLRASGAPDSLRISKEQIADLFEALKIKNPDARWRTLARLEKECAQIPEYWYCRAQAAYACLKEKGANAAWTADIRECVARYQQEEGVLRKDKTLANLLMIHLAAERLPPAQARAELEEIVEAAPLDPSKRLFAALVCLQYGMKEEAAECLQANLDMGRYPAVSRKLLSAIYAGDEKKLRALAESALADEAATSQEILWHLGRLAKGERFLADFLPQLEDITLRVSPSLLGKDTLELALPSRWELPEDAPATLTLDGEVFTATERKLEDGRLILIFPDAVRERELAARGDVPVAVRLETAFEPLTLFGTLFFPPREKSIIGRMTAAAKDLLPLSQAAFTLQKADVSGVSLERQGDAWVFVREKKTIGP